jgi:predicted nuclease of predicted toxin-antitoxin system
MRILVDASVSPVVVKLLRTAGHDAVHVGEVRRLNAPDADILEHAAREHRVVVAPDTDFGDLLGSRQAAKPSVVLFHRQTGGRPREQAALPGANLASLEADPSDSAIVVIEDRRVRVRALPITEPRADPRTLSLRG